MTTFSRNNKFIHHTHDDVSEMSNDYEFWFLSEALIGSLFRTYVTTIAKRILSAELSADNFHT